MHAVLRGISEEQAGVSPAPGRWSVLECLEHITFVEGRFLERLQAPPAVAPPPPDQSKEERLAHMVVDRSSPAQAPEIARPSGRFNSLAQALEAFNQARTQTIKYAAETGDRVYSACWEHPRFGVLNGGEILVLIANHARRHGEQIREVKAALAAKQ